MSATLTKIEMTGFCGAGDTQTLRLDTPITVLLGPNGSGKSTVAMAIEWALFGTAHAVTESGIPMAGHAQHLAYIHDGSLQAEVKLTFTKDQAEFVFSRIRTRRTPAPANDQVHVSLEGPADPAALFNVTADVYKRTVAPAQSMIQSIIAGNAAERNTAMDRLLGIEDLNAAVGGLNSAVRGVTTDVNTLAERWTNVQARLQAEAERRFEVRTNARTAAIDKGAQVRTLTIGWARTEAVDLSNALKVAPPPADAAMDILGQQVDQLWLAANNAFAMPLAAAVLQRAQTVQGHVMGPRAAWQNAIWQRRAAKEALDAAIGNHGGENDINGRIATCNKSIQRLTDQIADVSKHAAVLAAARNWLNEQSDGDLRCPVCKNPSVKEELSKLVATRYAELDGPDGTLARLRNELEDANTNLAALNTALGAVQGVVNALTAAVTEVVRARNAMIQGTQQAQAVWQGIMRDAQEADAVRLCDQVAEAGLALRNNEPPDAPVEAENACDALLRQLLAESERLQGWARGEIEAATARSQETRWRIIILGLVLEFLTAEASLNALDATMKSPELLAAQQQIERAEAWKKTLEQVRDALAEASNEAADAIVEGIRPRLREAFKGLSRHDGLRIATVGVETTRHGGNVRNAYTIRAGEDVWAAGGAPRLSGGYQIALALSALYALAGGDAPLHGLGLLVLDEPNERLDEEMQQRVASLLATQPPARRILVTTVDPAFAASLWKIGGAANVATFNLGAWTPARGTVINGGA
jgi:ABC-type branched-subunit amino acid transport system ATPase component